MAAVATILFMICIHIRSGEVTISNYEDIVAELNQKPDFHYHTPEDIRSKEDGWARLKDGGWYVSDKPLTTKKRILDDVTFTYAEIIEFCDDLSNDRQNAGTYQGIWMVSYYLGKEAVKKIEAEKEIERIWGPVQ